MIKQESIDLVREVDLLSVINRYTDVHLKKSGSSYKGKSPFVEEKEPVILCEPC